MEQVKIKSDGWRVHVGVGVLIVVVWLLGSVAVGTGDMRNDSFALEQAALNRMAEDTEFLAVRVDGHFKNAEFHAAQAEQMKALCKLGFECNPDEIEEELRRAATERGLQEKLSAGLILRSQEAAEAAVGNH